MKFLSEAGMDYKVAITIKWYHEKLRIKNWGELTASEYPRRQPNENVEFNLHS